MSSSRVRRFVVLFALMAAGSAAAQAPTRVTSPNGRRVLELRTGVQPNTGLLRTVVVTDGPLAQTTSLMVNTAFVRDIVGPNPPPMTWTVLVSSGTLFSLGGGCARGNQVDFPYINNNKLAIARFVGTTSTIITATINSAANYESVNCTVSADGQSTLFVLSNSTAQRTEIWRQNNNNVFTLLRQFGQPAKLPFVGGMRPSISRQLRPPVPRASAAKAVSGAAESPFVPFRAVVSDQIVAGGGAIRFQVFDENANTLDLVAATASNPNAVPPVESLTLSDCGVAGYDGNGVVIRAIGNNHCTLLVNPTVAGNHVGQNGYSYVSSGAYYENRTGLVHVYNGTHTIAGAGVAAASGPSQHPGTGGPFSLCHFAPSSNVVRGNLAVGPEPTDANSVRFAYWSSGRPEGIFVDDFSGFPVPMNNLDAVDCGDFDERGGD